MKKIVFLLFIVGLFIPGKIFATECTKEQISRYEKLANEIQTTFNYVENNDDIIFTIVFHNVDKDFYFVDYNSYEYLVKYDNNVDGVIYVPNCKSNTSYKISILNKKNVCDTRIIKTITVTTPNYNKYYKDLLCVGIESYSLCKKWSNIGNMTYKEFQKNVENYKKELLNNDKKTDNQIEDNLWNRIRNFIANYYIFIVIGGLSIAAIVIFIYKNNKKNSW